MTSKFVTLYIYFVRTVQQRLYGPKPFSREDENVGNRGITKTFTYTLSPRTFLCTSLLSRKKNICSSKNNEKNVHNQTSKECKIIITNRYENRKIGVSIVI